MNVNRIIQEKGFKKKAIAEKAGISQQRFSMMLTGKMMIREENIKPICDALCVEPNDLYITCDEDGEINA